MAGSSCIFAVAELLLECFQPQRQLTLLATVRGTAKHSTAQHCAPLNYLPQPSIKLKLASKLCQNPAEPRAEHTQPTSFSPEPSAS